MKILFASANENKIIEVKKILSNHEVISLNEVGYYEDIEETGLTYEENAKIKGSTISEIFPEYLVIADDSGIEFDSLNGMPGVYSHRFKGDLTEKERNQYVIKKSNETNQRGAHYICCMVLYKGGKHIKSIQESVSGTVTNEVHEGRLFAYDSIFKTPGIHKS